jgi:hypothetical protein
MGEVLAKLEAQTCFALAKLEAQTCFALAKLEAQTLCFTLCRAKTSG